MKVKACPFCGSTDVGVFTLENNSRQKAVGCKCGAEGPSSGRTAEAVKAWNTRYVFQGEWTELGKPCR